jgi:protein TonB
MFERAEVRRTGRAVSFTLAALAHGLLLVAALVLLRKQAESEQKDPPIIKLQPPPRPRPPGPPRRNGDPAEKKTHAPRTRPPPRPVDLAPTPVEETEPVPDTLPEPGFASEPDGRGERPSGPAGPDGNPGGDDCIGPGCGGTSVGPSPTDVMVLQAGVVRPLALCNPAAPTMPEQARIMGITGAVVMRYVVETDGSVSRIQVRNSDAPPVLVEAVRTWLERCRFKPGIARGQDARIQIDQPFVFKLR